MGIIAILSDKNSPRLEHIRNVISDKYDVLEMREQRVLIGLLENSMDTLSLLIIDNPSNIKGIDDILDLIRRKNNYMLSLPVIVLTDQEHMVGDDNYLDSPVVGVISTCDSEKVTLTRIANSIKLSVSISFDDFSNMLRALPSLIYIKDKQGRYTFASHNWHHMYKEGQSIRGKTDLDIRKGKENAVIAMKSDLEVLTTGKGKNYIIKEDDEEGVDYLQVIKEPLKNENGEPYGVIAIINNVTDQELLRQELKQKSITDQLTGLYNRAYFDELTQHKQWKK